MLIVGRWPARALAAFMMTTVLVTLVHLQVRLNHLQEESYHLQEQPHHLQEELMMVSNKYLTYVVNKHLKEQFHISEDY